MPDISMCDGVGCADLWTCYRHNAAPTPFRQSYFAEPPGTSKEDCDYYMVDRKSVPQPKRGKKVWPPS